MSKHNESYDMSPEDWSRLNSEPEYPGTHAPKKLPRSETVNHPTHYNTGVIEVITAIEDWKLNFNTGNAVKYIARAGKKDPAKHKEDLEKAIWYLQRELNSI